MAPLRIVDAGALHVPVIAALHEQCFDEAWSAESITGLLAMPGTFGLIALGSVGPVGFILCRVAGDECEVLALGVIPADRRTGVAGAILDAALANASGRGARRVFLEVAEDNRAALGLYSVHGFAHVGRRAGYYGGAAGTKGDALILSRDLGS
jgi:[ribosomal protein S18]-alanine N-acetyltransferase